MGLNAAFEQWPSDFLDGSAVRGHVGGDEAHLGIMLIGEETILTQGIWSPWFTGRAAPYGTRPYPIELLTPKCPLPQPKTSLEAFISNLLSTEDITEIEIQTHLLIGEYIAEVHESWAADYLLENLFNNERAHGAKYDELWDFVEGLA